MSISSQKVKKVVVVGGGTAGWLAAASMSKLLGQDIEVTLIESDEIGTVGAVSYTHLTLPTTD